MAVTETFSLAMTARRFPAPWSAEVQPACIGALKQMFVVKSQVLLTGLSTQKDTG
jgi:hypothetical protein